MNHRPELLNNDFIFCYPSYLDTNAPLNLPVGRLIGFDSDKNDVLKYYGSNECVYVDESSGFFYIKKSKNCNFDYDHEYYIHTYLEFTPKVCDSQDICSEEQNAVIAPLLHEHVIPIKVISKKLQKAEVTENECGSLTKNKNNQGGVNFREQNLSQNASSLFSQ